MIRRFRRRLARMTAPDSTPLHRCCRRTLLLGLRGSKQQVLPRLTRPRARRELCVYRRNNRYRASVGLCRCRVLHRSRAFYPPMPRSTTLRGPVFRVHAVQADQWRRRGDGGNRAVALAEPCGSGRQLGLSKMWKQGPGWRALRHSGGSLHAGGLRRVREQRRSSASPIGLQVRFTSQTHERFEIPRVPSTHPGTGRCRNMHAIVQQRTAVGW